MDQNYNPYKISDEADKILKGMWISRQSKSLYRAIQSGKMKLPTKSAFIVIGRLFRDNMIQRSYEVCPEYKFMEDGAAFDLHFECFRSLLIEVDGTYHMGDEQKEKDENRDKAASCNDYTVVRICNDTAILYLDVVMNYIYGVGCLQNKIDTEFPFLNSETDPEEYYEQLSRALR